MYRHPKSWPCQRSGIDYQNPCLTKYKSDPMKLHGKFKLRLDKEPLEIIIADFIAGMTDRYAVKMYGQLK